ncbi:MAG: hypothetical protein DMF14_06935 [Verrucomicrobia bacterium]|nr:MAG: hypothetical protein DME40_12710 [Verrucomicrobiota bacterium]PYL91458.1 MAG: hypothetical protein DMF14_06935 [Verrucomicrobiota bacterium]
MVDTGFNKFTIQLEASHARKVRAREDALVRAGLAITDEPRAWPEARPLPRRTPRLARFFRPPSLVIFQSGISACKSAIDFETSDPLKIHVFDTYHLGRANIIAVTALETDRGLVLFDAGPESAFQRIVSELRKVGFQPTDVCHVFLSHIHFDHAGAAWRFAELGATVYVHPRGLPHLLDPGNSSLPLNASLAMKWKNFGGALRLCRQIALKRWRTVKSFSFRRSRSARLPHPDTPAIITFIIGMIASLAATLPASVSVLVHQSHRSFHRSCTSNNGMTRSPKFAP